MRLDAGDIPALQPLIDAAVRTTLAQVEAEGQRLNGHLSFNEARAAEILGIQKHALRDLRLSGQVVGCKLGARVCYAREELLRLLHAKRMS